MALLKIYDVNVISDPICNKRVDNLVDSDFDYYDKDGFELNKAEQKFYTAKGHKLDTECLNHVCFQQTWITNCTANQCDQIRCYLPLGQLFCSKWVPEA